MAITLRTLSDAGTTTKNAPLTNSEVDQNFIDLKAAAAAAQAAADLANTEITNLETTVTNTVTSMPDPIVF
jgi:hypothetical protein